MTRTVRDAAIMLRAMAGYDPKDSTSVKAPVPDYEAAMTGDIKGMKIGIPREYRVEGMSAEIDALWQQGVKRSEEHTSELQSLMRISYAVFCLKKKTHHRTSNRRKKNSRSLL